METLGRSPGYDRRYPTEETKALIDNPYEPSPTVTESTLSPKRSAAPNAFGSCLLVCGIVSVFVAMAAWPNSWMTGSPEAFAWLPAFAMGFILFFFGMGRFTSVVAYAISIATITFWAACYYANWNAVIRFEEPLLYSMPIPAIIASVVILFAVTIRCTRVASRLRHTLANRG
jgi:hypothetical protein